MYTYDDGIMLWSDLISDILLFLYRTVTLNLILLCIWLGNIILSTTTWINVHRSLVMKSITA